jgi:hypothetical protein
MLEPRQAWKPNEVASFSEITGIHRQICGFGLDPTVNQLD